MLCHLFVVKIGGEEGGHCEGVGGGGLRINKKEELG